MGFLITAILVVNNLRDIVSDRVAGKMTLAVRLGVRGTRREYLILTAGAYLIPLGLWIARLAPAWVLLSWLSAPMAVSLVRLVWSHEGRPLNKALGGTGQLALFYSGLFSLGLIIGKLSTL